MFFLCNIKKNFNKNLKSNDLENVGEDSSKELNNSENTNMDSSEESNDLKVDFLEESNYSQKNNDINFSEEFVSDDSYSEYLQTISSEHSNNLSDGLLNENSDELDESDELNKFDDLLDNEFFEKIVNKALDFEELPQNTNKFSSYFENLTAALLFCWIQKHSI
ncbi:45154_t:CDS:1, partial [Gigaspora margarita]